jgi:hypothetical protein
VSLAGPPPASTVREITIRVDAAAPSQVFLERFTPISVDEYFRDFLAAGSAVAETPSDAGGEP